MNFIVTGGAGFLGYHVCKRLINEGHEVVSLDSYRHQGCPTRHIKEVRYIPCDLASGITYRTKYQIEESFSDFGNVDLSIINLASWSHVDTSIKHPEDFIKNNVNLAINMLEYAREFLPDYFFQFSTDEVFGPAPDAYSHHEWDSIIPSNPYAASKAAQEAIAISYWRTYGVPVIITNTMNLIGETQDPEKYVPMMIQRIQNQELIKVHGSPKNIGSRYYIYVGDVADAIYYIVKNTKPTIYKDSSNEPRPDRYNIVGREEINNLEMLNICEEILNKKAIWEFEDFHKTRPGHDRRYALNGNKLKDLGWEPKTEIKEAIKKIKEFNKENPQFLV